MLYLRPHYVTQTPNLNRSLNIVFKSGHYEEDERSQRHHEVRVSTP